MPRATSNKKERRAGGRVEKPCILVVCEGETELQYFRALRSKYRASWLEVKKSDRTDPLGIVECAKRVTDELNSKGLQVEAWVVFDAESTTEETRRHYRDAISAALSSGQGVANSSPCFEY